MPMRESRAGAEAGEQLWREVTLTGNKLEIAIKEINKNHGTLLDTPKEELDGLKEIANEYIEKVDRFTPDKAQEDELYQQAKNIIETSDPVEA